MSTPTQSNTPVQPSSASKKAPGHVTTPSAPRSVPSPAATRKEQSGKTPINHATASSHGSKTLGGTPMVQNLSQTGMTVSSSPGGHIGSFGTPLHGLGVDIGSGTPGALNVPTPLLQSVAMQTTMSEIMGTASKRNEDEERRLRMRSILKMIGKSKGKSSEEGIARIARRVGLVCDIDSEVLKPDERHRIGNRPITMAGDGGKMMIDIQLMEHVTQDVTVTFYGGSKALEEQQKLAGLVLLQDLAVPDGIPINTSLDRFGVNLNRLAKMDKLSAPKEGNVNCFEAIAGLFTSLNRLHEWEKEAIKTFKSYTGANADARAQREVLCSRSGKPTVHDNGRIGLALNYWTAGNRCNFGGHDESAMDMDTTKPTKMAMDSTDEMWSLQIEVEKHSANMATPLRVSDGWLPEKLEATSFESMQSIPWQDPPPTYVDAQIDQNDAMAIGVQKLPDLRFVAKLEPPVVIPFATLMNIHSALQEPMPPISTYPIYHLLALNTNNSNIARGLRADLNVLSARGDQEVDVSHRYGLDVPKMELGYKLDRLPFSHPRQLVELLPTLRQWVQTTILLRSVFGDDPMTLEGESTTIGTNGNNGVMGLQMNGGASTPTDSGIGLGDIMEIDSDSREQLQVDISLSNVPHPTFSISYCNTGPDEDQVCDLDIQVLPNGGIVVTDYDGTPIEAAQSETTDVSTGPARVVQEDRAKIAARALEACSDLGVWIEWIRSTK